MNSVYLTIYTIFVKSFTYKKGALAVGSIPASIVLEQFIQGESFFGISLGLCMVLSVLIIIDFVTGIIASKVNAQKIKSHLLANTIYKCMMIFLFFWFLYEINLQLELNIDKNNPRQVSDFIYSNGKPFVAFIRTFMFILITFREWISIGENSERILGHKLYLFSLTEKLFDVIERKFISKIENSDVCETGETPDRRRSRGRRDDDDNNFDRRDML